MVAFLTTWPLIDGVARSWQELSCLAESLNNAREATIAFVPDIQSVHPDDNDLLSRRMRALGLEATEVARFRPGIIVDLHTICVACDSRTQCDADLKSVSPEDDGSDAQAWQDYCPNVATLNMLSSLLPGMRVMTRSAA